MTTPDLLTPTRITAWLGCAHTMTLATDGQQRSAPVYGSFARLLMDKGDAHEHAHLERLRAEGRDVVSVPPKEDDESFEAWAARSRPLLSAGHEVLFQFPFVHDGVRGVADFLERVESPSELGPFAYEPVDAKLARSDAKPGHVLQLCFYADALEAVQGVRPRAVHLELGSGARESVVLATVDAYWRRVRSQLVKVLASPVDTKPVPCAQCQQCRFAPECTTRWIAEDALHRVASIRANEVEECAAAGITTLTALATGEGPVPGLKDARLHHLRRQAALQLARPDGGVPGFEVIERAPDGSPEELLARLPIADDGDVFLDFEGDPVWRADTGLFFLFGALVRDSSSADGWAYRTWWAHDLREEAVATAALIDWLADRRTEHPGMHVYHYNHTERSSLVTLAQRHGAGEAVLAELIEQGVFVDLLETVRRTVRIGAESSSLKQVELVAGFERSHGIDAGAGAVISYERWMQSSAAAELESIARYNEDDVRATLAVRDWLLDVVLDDVAPREAPEAQDAVERETDALVAALLATGVDWHELLAQMLEYWAREGRAIRAQALAQLDGEEPDHLRRPTVAGGLEFVHVEARKGRQESDTLVLRYPPQRFEARVRNGRAPSLLFPSPDGLAPTTVTIRAHDEEARELSVSWPETNGDPHQHPLAMATVRLSNADPKPATLIAFAQRVLDGATRASDAARIALLQRQMPRFAGDPNAATAPAELSADPSALADLVAWLDDSTLALQGPPGTGKTYTGARVIADLVARGQHVGITAFSHAAIDNLVDELLRVAPSVRVLRQRQSGVEDLKERDGVTLSNTVVKSWDPERYDVLAATTWPMTSLAALEETTLDLLVIDEAGQLGLADAIAAMGCARNVLLLGDPLQLAQVTQATHPGTSGRSTLEHVLGEAATMPPGRGVFLPVTRRMHAAITSVLSQQVYEGRLSAHPDCATHAVGGASGLRYIRAEHTGRSTESVEEARIVCDLARSLIGTPWTDSARSDASGAALRSRTVPLPAERVMVITPYNDQVDLVRRELDADPTTAGVRVGTVDKLQGQEAAVVIFSMATSSGEDMTRSVDFLFSRNRLNVAISRARTLAYVVCTDALLDTRAKDVETMQLIGTLCALVEAAEEVPSRA